MGIGLLLILIFSGIYIYLICKSIWENTPEAWIALLIGGLGTIATFELGYVAIWQNQQAQKLSETMLKMEKNGKHSLLFIKKHFIYQRTKLGEKFIENSKMAPVDYFVATDDGEKKDHIEKLILYCIVDNLQLEELIVKNIRFVGTNDVVQFNLLEGIDTSIVYDIDEKEYVIEIDFLSGTRVFDCIKSNECYLEITFEYSNIFEIRDSRICELNFNNVFSKKEIDGFASEKQSFNITSIAYRRNKKMSDSKRNISVNEELIGSSQESRGLGSNQNNQINNQNKLANYGLNSNQNNTSLLNEGLNSDQNNGGGGDK